MKYSDFEKIVFNNVKDFNPVHIFECGQVFRWLPEEGSYGKSYTGVCGSYTARVTFESEILTIEASGGDREFWSNYFDLTTDYTKIKDAASEYSIRTYSKPSFPL